MCLLLVILYLSVNTFSFGGNFATPGPKHLDTAMKYVGFKERGYNRGSLPDKCNKLAGVPMKSSWCATFVNFVLKSSGIDMHVKHPARARSYITSKSIDAKRVARGWVIVPKGWLVIFANGNYADYELDKAGHIGFTAIEWRGPKGKTVEANTPSGAKGSQADGDGVYIKTRIIQKGKFRITHFTPVVNT